MRGASTEAPRIPPFLNRYGTSTPSTKSWIRPAPNPPELTVSEPARVLTSSRSFAASAWRMPIAAARPVTFTPAASPLTAMVSLPAVPLTMTRSACAVACRAAECGCEVEVDLADAGAAEVVDRDGVGAAEGVEVDGLDAGCVHGDVAGVAEEPEPASVGGDVDLFGCGGAVEDHPVVAVLALDDVAAVARIPDERVVARAHESGVGSAVAVDRVVPVAADRLLDARAAGDPVAAAAAVEREGDRPGGESDGREAVDAAGAVDDELVGRVLMLHRHLGRRPLTLTPAASPLTATMSSPAVPLTVTGRPGRRLPVPPSAACEVEVDLADAGAAEVVDLDVSVPPRALKSTVSTLAVSIVMLPGLRKNLSRLPLAETSTCSAAAAPLKTIRSLPSWPSTMSLPSPGSQTNVSSPEPIRAVSAPRLPSIESLPPEPISSLRSGATGQGVVPVAAVERRRDRVREDAVRLVDAHRVVAVTGVDVDAVDVLALEVERVLACVSDVDLEHVGPAGLEAKHDRVVARRPLDRQHAVLQLRVLEPLVLGTSSRAVVTRRSGLALAGHDPGCADDDGRHRRHRHQQPTRALRLAGLVVSEVDHDVPFRVVELSSARDTADGAPIPARNVRAV